MTLSSPRIALFLALLAVPSWAGKDPDPVPAKAGLAAARAAALAWAQDAVLVYIENDEDLAAGGGSPRWSYLFRSGAKKRARGYSVRDGEIVASSYLPFAFDSPPNQEGWIDSGAAERAADEKGGREYRDLHGGAPATMLLMRGAFYDKDPDLTTWTVIYRAPGAPSLFVLVDAATGKAKRSWVG